MRIVMKTPNPRPATIIATPMISGKLAMFIPISSRRPIRAFVHTNEHKEAFGCMDMPKAEIDRTIFG